MLHKLLKTSSVLLLGFGFTGLHAQTSVNTVGGNASGSGGSASYSAGQVTYQIHTNTKGSVAEGVQQPYEISVISAIEETKEIIHLISAYPNPTSDHLKLYINESDISGLSYQLFDLHGKLLKTQKITDKQTSIVMSNLAADTYFLKVIQKNKEVKTFKIIKY